MITLCWRGVKLVADVLTKNPPARVKIKLEGDWIKDGHIRPFARTSTMSLPSGMFQLLLTPLGRVQESSPSTHIELRAPRSVLDILEPLKALHSLTASADGRCMLQLPPEALCDDPSQHTGLIGRLRQQQYYDLCLDRLLDFMPAGKGESLPQQRWKTWHRDYEVAMIAAASDLPETQRNMFLTDLAERWTVWRAMDPQSRREDLIGWGGRTDQRPSNLTPAQRARVLYSWSNEWGYPARGD